MGLWGCGLSESELDRDRWHTCEEGSEPCSSNSGNLLIIFTEMTLLPGIC